MYSKVKSAYFSKEIQLQMELLQERISQPQYFFKDRGSREGDENNYQQERESQPFQRSQYYAERIPSTTSNNQQPQQGPGSSAAIPNYFSKYSNYDTICGFEGSSDGFERSPAKSQYQSHYQQQQPSSENVNRNHSRNGEGSIAMNNGAVQINLPCVYTYPYDPKEKLSQQQPSVKKKKKLPPSKTKSGSQGCLSQTTSSSAKMRHKAQEYDAFCPPPFCSTVNSLKGPPNKGFITKELPQQSECDYSSQGRFKTSIKYDCQPAMDIPVRKVEYGEELYEKVVKNLARQLALENGAKPKSSKSGNSLEALKMEKCNDFSKPGYNSSLRVSGELGRALEQLNNLPIQMERIFMSDSRFEPIVLDKATKVLNVPRESKVFKDLVSVEQNDSVKQQVTKCISDQMKSVQPVKRSKDPEPNLLDYQKVEFSRIKPKPIPPPPKPQTNVAAGQSILRQVSEFLGLSVDIQSQTEHQLIQAETKFEDEADLI